MLGLDLRLTTPPYRNHGIAFSPSSVNGVRLWLDAGTITGVADGGTLAAANWTDSSKYNLGAMASTANVVYNAVGSSGKPSLTFNGTNSFVVTPTISVAAPRRVFMVFEYLGTLSSGAQNNKYVFDGAALDQGSLLLDSGATAAGGFAAIEGDTLSSNAATWAGLQNTACLVDMIVNGASSSIQVDGQNIKTGTFTHAATYTAMTLGAPGNQLAGFFGNFQLAELILCDNTITTTDAANIRTYLNNKHNLITRNFLICDGNSITAGQGSTGGTNGWVQQIPSLLTGGASKWIIQNNGVGGQTTPQMTSQASTGGNNTTDIRLGFYAKTIVTGWEITNDIVANDTTPPQATSLYNNIVAFFTGRRAANSAAKLVVFTCLPRTTITGAQETDRQTINSNIRANWSTFADALVDVDAITQLQNPADTTYYADGTHPNDAGHALIAQAAANVINTL